MRYQELILVNENDEIINFFALKKHYRIIDTLQEEKAIQRALIMSIFYFSDLHLKKRLFHGDIKPANIFICKDGGRFISSDSGSLTLLNNPQDRYLIKFHTPLYSSPDHKEAIFKGIGENAVDLKREDKFQLNTTFQVMLRILKRKKLPISQLTQLIMEKL